MAQIQKGDTFTDGQQVTASRLNQMIDSATILVNAITDQTSVPANGLIATDSFLVEDGGLLKKATIGDVLNSKLPVTAPSITGVTGSDLTLTPQSGQKVDIVGNAEVDNITVTQNATITGNLTTAGDVNFNTTAAIKIPSGTTVQRPVSPVVGQIRYNTTNNETEIYSGTEWKIVGGNPFDASGGTVTTIDGYKIHTFTTSGTFTPSLTKEGKVEVLVVGAGGAGASFNPHGGGGGGGDVKAGFVTIAKNTAPMAVVVGVGSSGAGTSSSFEGIVANGGQAGSGYTGGTSGSGIAGGTGTFVGAGGGAGAQTTQTFRWTDAGGVGGQGYGSSISGTLRTYGGGGGGGAGNSSTTLSAPGINGGGGQGNPPVANSGGGGSGSAQNDHASTNGANGIVIIRYRVS